MSMIRCLRCGKENQPAPGAQFCGQCGGPLGGGDMPLQSAPTMRADQASRHAARQSSSAKAGTAATTPVPPFETRLLLGLSLVLVVAIVAVLFVRARDSNHVSTVAAPAPVVTVTQTVQPPAGISSSPSIATPTPFPSATSPPTPPPTQTAGELKQIRAAFYKWKHDRETLDFDRYMACYHPNFHCPDKGYGYVQWRSFKRKLFDLYTRLDIDVGSPVFTRRQDGVWILHYYQRYVAYPKDHSSPYRSEGDKRLKYRRDGPTWKIVEENY